MPVWVTTADESRARDAAAIAALRAAGRESFDLMATAGTRAATHLMRTVLRQSSAPPVAVFIGPGNNGGDAWLVANALRLADHDVRVHEAGEARAHDAILARTLALSSGAFAPPDGTEPVVIDGLLGTGASGPPRGGIAAALAQLRDARARGATIIALDIPSALDATTGDDHGAAPAHQTLTFGTVKRGLLMRRDISGHIVVLDIGVHDTVVPNDTAVPALDADAVRRSVPRITATAHKGTRGRVLIAGGAPGMAGACIIAANGALRSGAGLVSCVVAPESRTALQAAVPYATTRTWNDALPSADAAVIGPGLGDDARQRVVVWLRALLPDTPLVLDADALNAFTGDVAALRDAIGTRTAILTPHPAECARLLGMSTADVLRDRFTVGRTLARATSAVVILKGTPTVISAPDGRVVVAPLGSPVLATGGSGDLLAGILGALFAVMPDAFAAAQAAVWAHGTAAERAATSPVRGVTLADVESELAFVWHAPSRTLESDVLAELPFVGE
jgi:NAD(P)H-hydrate epimerase